MRLVLLLSLFVFLAVSASAQAATVQIPGDPMVVLRKRRRPRYWTTRGRYHKRLLRLAEQRHPERGVLPRVPRWRRGGPGRSSNVRCGRLGRLQRHLPGHTDGQPGPPANPYRVTTVYGVPNSTGTAAQVTQVVTYLNGASRFSVSYAVKNLMAAPLRFRAGEWADLYLAGSDSGTGFFQAGPPATRGRVQRRQRTRRRNRGGSGLALGRLRGGRVQHRVREPRQPDGPGP